MKEEKFNYVQEWMRQHPEFAKKSVGFGKPTVHTPTIEGVSV
jgi:hypothetical protein